jgi:hypothetical protein
MFEDDSRDSFADPDPAPARKPAAIPAKFWDQSKGELRTEALLQAYLELERRVSARGGIEIPDSAEKYAISVRHPAVTSDLEVNKRLHEAGFTQQQAQLVYDLAFERLVPLLVAAGAEAGPESEAGPDSAAPDPRDGDISHLCDHFGGEARWRQIAPQLAAWGRKSLPPEAFEVLASSVEGVKTLHRLMGSGEPSLGRAPAPRDEGQSENQLKTMIQDPRYWKSRDPAFIAKVTDGFRRLYGEG